MSLNCFVGIHSPLPAAAANQGVQFSSCRRCGRDMVRIGKSWRRVPKGFRVVWKSRAEAAAPRAGRVRAQNFDRVPPHRRRAIAFPALGGLVDLIRAALRVLSWSCRDGLRRFGRSMLALPRPRAAVLRLPAR
jgi:hypothetical protein